ncbi:unnamed protein product [Pleuronectes platessa]|uniref:Uncharacterized protein n=1 Tax=Pleuronectes platessa TaxID=8262 RepID=A0A9N7Z181_PLEPL|nr:unnamed protein product [Pleuronectes platessa]
MFTCVLDQDGKHSEEPEETEETEEPVETEETEEPEETEDPEDPEETEETEETEDTEMTQFEEHGKPASSPRPDLVGKWSTTWNRRNKNCTTDIMTSVKVEIGAETEVGVSGVSGRLLSNGMIKMDVSQGGVQALIVYKRQPDVGHTPPAQQLGVQWKTGIDPLTFWVVDDPLHPMSHSSLHLFPPILKETGFGDNDALRTIRSIAPTAAESAPALNPRNTGSTVILGFTNNSKP